MYWKRFRSWPGFPTLVRILAFFALLICARTAAGSISNAQRLARDERRLADVEHLQEALESYRREHGRYPEPVTTAGLSGWEASLNERFLFALVEAGLLEASPTDPVNDDRFHYRYYLYEPGAFGCDTTEPYFVLGIRAFETPDFARSHVGRMRCSARNWNEEFAFALGGGPDLH